MFIVGSLVRVGVVFSANNVPADPDVVTVIVKTPAGAETSHVYGTDAAVVRDGIGAYHLDQQCDVAGNWFARGKGTGAVIAATEIQFLIGPSAFVAP